MTLLVAHKTTFTPWSLKDEPLLCFGNWKKLENSDQNFKTISCYVRGRHQSSTMSFESDVTKTGEGFLFVKYVQRFW